MASRKGRCPCGAVLRLPGPDGNAPRVIRRPSRPQGKVDLCPQCLEALNGHASELIHGMRWCAPCALAYYEGKYRRLAAVTAQASQEQPLDQWQEEQSQPLATAQGEPPCDSDATNAPTTLADSASLTLVEDNHAEEWNDDVQADENASSQDEQRVSLWQLPRWETPPDAVVAPRGKPQPRFVPAHLNPSAAATRHRFSLTIALGVLLMMILLLVALAAGWRITPG